MNCWKTDNYIFLQSQQPPPPDLPISLIGTGHEIIQRGNYCFDNQKLSRYHKGEVFQLTLSGQGWYSDREDGRGKQPVPEGHAFLASPSSPFLYEYKGNAPWEFVYLTFTGTVAVLFFSRWRQENGSLLSLKNPSRLILRLKKLQEDLNGSEKRDYRSNSGTAYELLLLIDASIGQSEITTSVRRQTEEMIRQRLATVSVEDLARRWGYEPHYFITWLKQSSGITPGKLIRETQLEAASEYLIHSSRNITAIAEQCGFKDPGLFSRSFRKQYGMPPREYRKERRAPILSEPVFLSVEGNV